MKRFQIISALVLLLALMIGFTLVWISLSNPLLELAREKVPLLLDANGKSLGPLSETEVKMIRAVYTETFWSCPEDVPMKNDVPDNAGNWGNNRVLRAEVLSWLCKDDEAKKYIGEFIGIGRARIDGKLSFNNVDFGGRLILSECSITDGLECVNAHFGMLVITRSSVGDISADVLTVTGDFRLRGNYNAISLIGANIGNLHCSGNFKNISLVNAKIAKGLNCSFASFDNEGSVAINADGIKVGESVELSHDFSANGEVRLVGAEIGQDLYCRGGTFLNPGKVAINAEGLKVTGIKLQDGSIFAGAVVMDNGFKASGEVRFVGAKIQNSMYFENGTFDNEGGDAINASGLEIGGIIILEDEFIAHGTVRIPHEKIGARPRPRREESKVEAQN